MLLDQGFDRILPKAVTDIARIFEVEQAAIYDASADKTYRHGVGDDVQLREVAETGVAAHNPEEKYSVAPLRLSFSDDFRHLEKLHRLARFGTARTR